jgi:hypothetical protein
MWVNRYLFFASILLLYALSAVIFYDAWCRGSVQHLLRCLAGGG